MRKVIEISIMALGICLVYLATVAVQVYIPATRGYFNLGETMVYTFALLFGPRIGLVAGGVGSALADLITGYSIYAPGTLVIKAIEGYIVGYLSRILLKLGRRTWKILSVTIGVGASLGLASIGVTYYSSSSEASIGLPKIGYVTYTFMIPSYVWIIISVLLAVFILYFGLKADPKIGALVLSVIIGGFEMVLGYYLYERFILGYYALAEVPFNICQMLIGLLVSLPLYKALEKRVYLILKK